MSLVDGMLAQLKLRGLTVEYVGEDQLKVVGPKGEATPEVMQALKVFKKDLLAKLRPRDLEDRTDVHHPAPPPDAAAEPENCRECAGTVWDREETADLCDFKRCPFKARG
jgi:hypothetical protein